MKVFEVAPLLNIVELRKSNGDTLEFNKVYTLLSHSDHTFQFRIMNIWSTLIQFYKNLSTDLKDVLIVTGEANGAEDNQNYVQKSSSKYKNFFEDISLTEMWIFCFNGATKPVISAELMKLVC